MPTKAKHSVRGSGGAFALVPISTLRNDPSNVRTHSERNLEAVRKSLASFGQQKPIVALRDGTVIAGNATLQAARSLGWEEIGVAWTDLDETQAKAFAIADNRTAELADWDWDQLATQLEELGEAGFDVSALEITEEDLRERLQEVADAAGGVSPEQKDAAFEAVYADMDAAEVPEVGSVWRVGNATIAVAHPVTQLELWRDLLQEAEEFYPFASAFLLCEPRFRERKVLCLYALPEAAAFSLRMLRAMGVSAEQLR